jgi:hypothetical protein
MLTGHWAMKKAVLIMLAAVLLAYAVGFVHGQTREAKFRIKLELSMLVWLKKAADRGDNLEFRRFIELSIAAKTRMLEQMLHNPLAHYKAERAAMSDEEFERELPRLKKQIAGFQIQPEGKTNDK